MITVDLSGNAGITQLGDAAGRAIIADGLASRLRGQEPIMPDTLRAFSLSELTVTSMWLRTVILATCENLSIAPGNLAPPAEVHVTWTMARALDLSHQFLTGCLPYTEGGVEICCAACLIHMSAALGSAATTVTLMEWEGNPEVERYVISGRPLPAGAARVADEPAPVMS